MSQHQNILVIRLSAFGDVVRAFTYMAAIRRHHPDATITWMTTKPFATLADGSGYADDVWIIERWKFWQFGKWMAYARKLREKNITLVYDLQRNDRTGLMRRWAPAAVRRNWLARNEPHDKTLLDMRKGIDYPLADVSWMTADVARFGIKPPFALLVPGSAPQHPVKRWPADSYAALAKRMAEQGITPVALGTKDEKAVIDRMKALVPELVDLGGQTSFKDIAALGADAVSVVGNDTGPMHLIALTGCPVISLFSGTTDPDKSKPQGNRVTTLRAADIADIPVDDVWSAFTASKKS